MTPRAEIILGMDAQTTGIGWAAIGARTGTPFDAGWLPVRDEGFFERSAMLQIDLIPCTFFGWTVAQLVIERVGGGRGIQSMLKVADAAGIVSGLAVAKWPRAELWRPTPSEWKRGFGLSGNAKKDDVRAGVEYRYPDARDLRQDAVDAMAMAFAGYRTALEVA